MTMLRTAATSMALALILLTVPGASPVAAQTGDAGRLTTGGMDLHLFRPAVDSKGLLSVNGTDILGHLDFSFGLVIDGASGIVPFNGFLNSSNTTAMAAERRGRLVDFMFTGMLHFNLGIENLLVVGVQLPVVVGSGPNLTIPGVFNDFEATAGREGSNLDYQGLGNIALHTKFRILRMGRNDGWGLAALLQAELPTGSPLFFAGDPDLVLWPSLAVEYQPITGLRFALNLGYRFVLGEGTPMPVNGRTEPNMMLGSNALNAQLVNPGSDFVYDDQITFGFGGSLNIGNAVDFVLEVFGNQVVSGFGTEGALNLEAMGGLKIFVQQNSYLVLSGGGGIPVGGAIQADVRGMMGFVFEPSIGDRDGDGIRDDVDSCPSEPEDFDGFADEEGCPDPDNDRDGILDVDDECPLVPEDRDGDADADGCPEGNEGDRDGDGILDNDDECPDDPEDRDGFQDEEGCPDPDNDQDTILDTDDLCPDEPEDRDSFEDENGCPDLDNDEDRILDVDDACPNDPETYNGTEDEDGCPDTGTVVIEENSIVILEKIYFETDSAEILARSFPIVEAVAATLVGNPHITLIEIQGHADERSGDDYNIRLTRDRAAAVLEALVERGVARDRLRSAGYGERCPVDPRHNAQAWERNRRVEFKIIRTEDGPTGVEVACPRGRSLIPN